MCSAVILICKLGENMLIFSTVMAVITTALISVFGGFVTVWYDFWKVLLLLIGSYGVWCALIIIFAFFVTLPVNTKKPIKKPSKFYTWLFNFVNGWLVDSARIKLVVNGLEKIDPNTSYLFVYNHRSNFDSQIVPRLFKKHKILLISKPENIKTPIAGKCIHAMGYLAIDRENNRKAIETILKAADYLKNGHSIGLCPEGRRNKTGIDLLPFKNGAFKVAQRTKAPVVVLTLNGTEMIHKNFPLKRSVVHLDILDVIPADKVATMTTQELGDYSSEIMQANIDRYKQQNQQ